MISGTSNPLLELLQTPKCHLFNNLKEINNQHLSISNARYLLHSRCHHQLFLPFSYPKYYPSPQCLVGCLNPHQLPVLKKKKKKKPDWNPIYPVNTCCRYYLQHLLGTQSVTLQTHMQKLSIIL